MSTLSRKDTVSMRGTAILFIVLHNLIHLVCPLKENEFSFSIEMSKTFISHICEMSPELWKDVFSFLGWYGISIFLFISGYGLVRKYEKVEANNVQSFSFIKGHISKLFSLMLIPYLLYVFLKYILLDPNVPIRLIAYKVISQLLMISNLKPELIDPGVYWYFGLMVQFYIFYIVFLYNRKNANIIYWNIISIVVLLIFINVPYDMSHPDFISRILGCGLNFPRHNFIGWILPFTLGILYARKNFSITFSCQWLNYLSILVCVALLILSNLNIYLWLLSPIFSIMLATYFCHICNSMPCVNKIFIYLGGLSAFLFAVHPVVRYIYLYFTKSSAPFMVFIYFIACIIIAEGYRFLHKKLFA